MKQNAPIGLFDSGIGGLTVARQVMQQMPKENIIYFGDTARVPYGSKSAETVIGYSIQAADFLQSKGVKMIIIACNTASAVALGAVQSKVNVPVVGVIKPGAMSAAEISKTGRIGVIGTEGTIRSGAYKKYILENREDAIVFAVACPLFVALAEEGWSHHKATMLIAREYLTSLLQNSIDTLIMGCTHYPVLEPSIKEVCGLGVKLIDPGISTATVAKDILAELDLLNSSTQAPRYEYYLTDLPHKFVEVGEQFLGKKMMHYQRISPEELMKFGH